MPDSSQKKVGGGMKFLRLMMFLVACLGLGALALVLMFSPAINPRFVEEPMFMRDLHKAIGQVTKSQVFGRADDLEPLVVAMKNSSRAFTDEDFKRLSITKPDSFIATTSDGARVNGWYFKTPGATDTVIFSSDGYLNKAFTAELGYVKMLQDGGLSVIIYDYRDDSHLSTPTKDLAAVYEYATKQAKVDPSHIVLMGRTVGAYAACQVAQDHSFKALILEDPWSTLRSYYVQRSRPMALVPEALFPGLSNVEALNKIRPARLLIVRTHGRDAQTLHDTIQTPSKLVVEDDYSGFFCLDVKQASRSYVKQIHRLLSEQWVAKGDTTDAHGRETASAIAWKTDFAEAMAQAKRENKYVYLDFYTDWCGWCKRQDQTTFADAKVRRIMQDHLIAVKVNAEEPKVGVNLAMDYKVHGFPTSVLLAPNGELAGKKRGYIDAGTCYGWLESFVD